MSFDSTLYSNIKFTSEQTAFPVFNWNFSNFPLSFNCINIWNWGGFSNFCNFGDFNFWGGWNFKPEPQGKIDFSELWKQAGNVSENSDGSNPVALDKQYIKARTQAGTKVAYLEIVLTKPYIASITLPADLTRTVDLLTLPSNSKA